MMATRRTTDSPRTIPTLQPETPAEKAAPRKRAGKAAAPSQPAAAALTQAEISPDARRAMIAEAAYLRAERRGFTPGYELEDWIAAENEVDTLLDAEHTRRPQ
jgi:hypothetical protein